MANILIVDDHWLFSVALEGEVRRLQPEAACVRASSLGEALVLLRLGRRFDLALIDLRLPDSNGVGAVEVLKKEAPLMRIAVVSATEDVQVVRAVYRLEAAGYLSKAGAPESFERGLQLLLSGGFCYPHEVFEPTSRHADPHGLTPRESDVLGQLTQGMTSKQIARKLGLAPATVDKHVEQIRVKLGARSRIQLLARLADMERSVRGA